MFPCDAYWKLQLLGWTSGLSLSNLTGFICTMSAGGRVEILFSSDSNMSLLFIKVLARRQHSFFIPVDCFFLINLTSLLYHRTIFTILELQLLIYSGAIICLYLLYSQKCWYTVVVKEFRLCSRKLILCHGIFTRFLLGHASILASSKVCFRASGSLKFEIFWALLQPLQGWQGWACSTPSPLAALIIIALATFQQKSKHLVAYLLLIIIVYLFIKKFK